MGISHTCKFCLSDIRAINEVMPLFLSTQWDLYISVNRIVGIEWATIITSSGAYFSGCECKTLHIKWLSRINPTFVITLHADVPSNSGARPSPGTMLTTKTNLLTFSSFNSCRWNRMDQLMSSKDRRGLLKFLCTFECWSSTNENFSVCFVSYCTRFLFV